MSKAAKPRGRKPAAAKGHQLPEPIPEGFEMTDTHKRRWKIGSLIGSGGFGTVYFASEAGKKTFDFVIKVEHHGNGPLFTELHCYQNIGKPNDIAEWVKKNKLPFLGLSPMHGFGSFEFNGSKYRFMVIERYDKDLQKLFEESNRRFPEKTVYQVGLSMINVLEYIHAMGYVHGDIKPANLLLGRKKGTENQVYLVDMGLACKYQKDGVHKKDLPDPKKAHNGTPEFTSRDAHRGCFSRRTDMEILCYNLLQWLSGELPWEKYASDCKKLHQEKERYMKNIDEFLDVLNISKTGGMKKLLSYVSKLGFEEEPDYNLCRKIFKDELKKLGCDKDTTLDFTNPNKVTQAAEAPVSDKENSKKAAKPTREKRKPEADVLLPPGIVPTQAMLDIMEKRASAKETKPTKTRRKK
ncbi:hypothetical protein JTE90_008808 [Oedothorax gibbosus]|uniref:non-specific serine/threonine protein kinase n=1 Tax=Oedothorax gibbosus TaxID=931172 RepID=A0AAV6V4R0_9ARAC|nr:hypothetical protein JTE90_008808 [Oedothorax gibbosus]